MRTNVAFVVAAAMGFPAFGWGQADVAPLAGYTPGQVLQGGPAGSIALSGIEVFNPANNQISINIPLVTVHGRGPVSIPFLVPLTSPVWETMAVQYHYNCGEYRCSTGYGYIVQTSGWNPLSAAVGQGGNMVMRGSGDYCSNGVWHATLTRGTFTAPDGTQTEFIDQATSGTPENPGYSRGTASKIAIRVQNKKELMGFAVGDTPADRTWVANREPARNVPEGFSLAGRRGVRGFIATTVPAR